MSELAYKTAAAPVTIRVALAGNPNSGKTSIFNALTGAHQHVANFPGVTVEKRVGRRRRHDLVLEVLDLPGTYSLSAYSPEERVAAEELCGRTHDVVVVVVDSTALARSLVLLAQVMQLGANPVLVLNMADEARAAGLRLDLAAMRELLGFPVVETTAHRGGGIAELELAIRAAHHAPVRRHRLVLGERLEAALAALRPFLSATDLPPAAYDWVATRALVGDAPQAAELGRSAAGRAVLAEAEHQRRRLEAEVGSDVALYVTERFFGFVDGLLREVVVQPARRDARRVSDAVDQVLVHRVFGLPIFAAVMFGIFWLTFTLGEIPMGWLEAGFAWLGTTVAALWPAGVESPLRSLLVDGIIAGVGGVMVFLPNILLLFLGLAFLEDTGYMARAAFLVDRAMHRFGLHGKSFIPMLTGFGCSIPGIMATRTLENERDRLATMLVLPLISCGARLPIWLLLVPAFFPVAWRAPVLWLIYAIGIALALLLALLLRRTLLAGEEAPFVMELPPYRLPTVRAVITKMGERGWLYLRKAGTVILAISVLMWVLTAYPKAEQYEIDRALAEGRLALEGSATGVEVITAAELERRRGAEDLAASVAGRLGQLLEPVVRPLGFDARLATAMLGAFAAKEVFVSQLGIVYAMEEGDEGATSLRAALARDYSPLTGFCMILFLLIATPCMATFAVTRRESGSWRWAALQLGGLTAVAYLLTLVVYQLGRLVG